MIKLIKTLYLLFHSILIRRLKIVYTKLFSKSLEKCDYSNQTVLITGAASGFGRQLAYDFLSLRKRAPKNLILWDVSPNLFKEFDTGRKNGNTKIFLDQFDIREQNYNKMQQLLKNKYSDINVAILNAGIGVGKPFQTFDTNLLKYFKTMEVNFNANVYATKYLMEYHSKSIRNVLYMSSAGGYVAAPLMSEYIPSKYAIRSFAECIAKEYYFKKETRNVSFRVICPYFCRTALLDPMGEKRIKKLPFKVDIRDVSRACFDSMYYDIDILVVGWMGYFYKYLYQLVGSDKRM